MPNLIRAVKSILLCYENNANIWNINTYVLRKGARYYSECWGVVVTNIWPDEIEARLK